MELVDELIAIMKQHERNLDVQLRGCSLLLRVLGQGGRCARCVLGVYPGAGLGGSQKPALAARCPSAAVWAGGRSPTLGAFGRPCSKRLWRPAAS